MTKISLLKAASGSWPALLHEHMFSHKPRLMTYGAGVPTAMTSESVVEQTDAQVSTHSLRKQVEDIKARLAAGNIQLLSHVREAPQSVQQTSAIIGPPLECTNITEGETLKLGRILRAGFTDGPY